MSTTTPHNRPNKFNIPPSPSTPPPRAILLTSSQWAAAVGLMAAFENDVSIWAELPDIGIGDIRFSSRILVSSGDSSIGEPRRTPSRKWNYLIGASGKPGTPYLDIRFKMQIPANFPHVPKNEPGNQRTHVGEVCIPRGLRGYAPGLSGLSAFWRPDQAAANVCSIETARPTGDPLRLHCTRARASPRNRGPPQWRGGRRGSFAAANKNSGFAQLSAA